MAEVPPAAKIREAVRRTVAVRIIISWCGVSPRLARKGVLHWLAWYPNVMKEGDA
jgi:hypothetical protein